MAKRVEGRLRDPHRSYDWDYFFQYDTSAESNLARVYARVKNVVGFHGLDQHELRRLRRFLNKERDAYTNDIKDLRDLLSTCRSAAERVRMIPDEESESIPLTPLHESPVVPIKEKPRLSRVEQWLVWTHPVTLVMFVLRGLVSIAVSIARQELLRPVVILVSSTAAGLACYEILLGMKTVPSEAIKTAATVAGTIAGILGAAWKAREKKDAETR